MTATTPRRIQRRRTRGWRMPEGAVSVTRPGKWGNPYRVEGLGTLVDVLRAVRSFRQYLREHPELVAAARAELAGKDLACWCREGDPCHGDVLLAVANGEEP